MVCEFHPKLMGISIIGARNVRDVAETVVEAVRLLECSVQFKFGQVSFPVHADQTVEKVLAEYEASQPKQGKPTSSYDGVGHAGKAFLKSLEARNGRVPQAS